MDQNSNSVLLAPHSVIEPPVGPNFTGRETLIRELMSAMGRKSRPQFIYTTLPACNSD